MIGCVDEVFIWWMRARPMGRCVARAFGGCCMPRMPRMAGVNRRCGTAVCHCFSVVLFVAPFVRAGGGGGGWSEPSGIGSVSPAAGTRERAVRTPIVHTLPGGRRCVAVGGSRSRPRVSAGRLSDRTADAHPVVGDRRVCAPVAAAVSRSWVRRLGRGLLPLGFSAGVTGDGARGPAPEDTRTARPRSRGPAGVPSHGGHSTNVQSIRDSKRIVCTGARPIVHRRRRRCPGVAGHAA